MIKDKFKLQYGRVLLMIFMLCESLSCQEKATIKIDVQVHTRSDYCGKYGKYFGIYSQCELNQGPCYGDEYCKGNLVCGHGNCGYGYNSVDNCCKCNCKGTGLTGSCDSEDGTCHFDDDYEPYDITANDNVIHDYEDYDPNDEPSNNILLRIILGIVMYCVLLCCVCSFFYLLDKDKL